MNNSAPANSISASVRIYRALLVAYPKKFREHYETSMVQVFRDSFKDAYHSNGLPGVIGLWLHTCADLLVTAFMERISERSQYMFSPKVTMWGGLAGVFSGMFWLMMATAPSSGGLSIVLALVLGLAGLAGLYSRQAGQGGKLGLAGFAVGIMGTLLALGTLGWGLSSGHLSSGSAAGREPALVAQIILICMVALATLGVGLVLLGVASLRAKTLHRWRGLPLGLGLLNLIQGILGWLIFYVPLSQGRNPWVPWNPGNYAPAYLAFALSGLGWMGLGIMLATQAEAKVAQPPASAKIDT
jgi:hypothetical protein